MHTDNNTPLWEYSSSSPEITQALGRWLGQQLQGGEIFLLDGNLGAGKTCLTSGLAQGMGIGEPTISPTYIILRSYDAPSGLTLHHFDFYRLSGSEDLETVEFEDCLNDESAVVIEWPERCPEVYDEYSLRLELHTPKEQPESRTIRAYPGVLPIEDSLKMLPTEFP